MKKYLFRGQTRKFGEMIDMGGRKVPGIWVYGGIYSFSDGQTIIYGGLTELELEKHVVYTDTVGQYIGIDDKNKVAVFEGDILAYGDKCGVVNFHNGCFCVEEIDCGNGNPKNPTIDVVLSRYHGIEVIGNIHENKELLDMVRNAKNRQSCLTNLDP